MLGAGLLAKKAVEKGLKVSRHVKTSLAPGSRVVTSYLKKAGLQEYLDHLGFHLVDTDVRLASEIADHLNQRLKKRLDKKTLLWLL